MCDSNKNDKKHENKKGDEDMAKVIENKDRRISDNSSTKRKRDLLKNFIGSNTSQLDLNKVRDEWKYGKNRF